MDHEQRHKCRTFLRKHDAGVIATSSVDGQPHASVVNYFSTDDFQIYFLAREDAEKFKNIQANSRACIVITDEDSVVSLELKGNAHKMEDTPEVMKLLSKLSEAVRRRNPGPIPIINHPGSELYLFCLKPKHITYADFRPSHLGEYFEVDV